MPPGLSFCPVAGMESSLTRLTRQKQTLSTLSLVTIALLVKAMV
jgi:hypothetical protein